MVWGARWHSWSMSGSWWVLEWSHVYPWWLALYLTLFHFINTLLYFTSIYQPMRSYFNLHPLQNDCRHTRCCGGNDPSLMRVEDPKNNVKRCVELVWIRWFELTSWTELVGLSWLNWFGLTDLVWFGWLLGESVWLDWFGLTVCVELVGVSWFGRVGLDYLTWQVCLLWFGLTDLAWLI